MAFDRATAKKATMFVISLVVTEGVCLLFACESGAYKQQGGVAQLYRLQDR